MDEGDTKTPDTLPEARVEQSIDKETADLAKYVRSLIVSMDFESMEKFLQENDNLPNFIADEIIESGKGSLVAEYLYRFKNLDHTETTKRLIKKGRASDVIEYISLFEDVDQNEIYPEFLKMGFKNISPSYLSKGIFLNLIQTDLDPEEAYNVYSNIWRLKELDEEIVTALIVKKQCWVVTQNINKVTGMDHKTVAMEIIKAEGCGTVAQYIDKFEGLDHNEIALKIIEAGNGWYVGENLHKFKGLGREVAIKLLGFDEEGLCKVVMFLDRFVNLDKEVAMKIIEMGDINAVIKNLEKFNGLDKEVALKLMESPEGTKAMALNLDKFEGLDEEIIRKLQEYGEGASLMTIVQTPEQ